MWYVYEGCCGETLHERRCRLAHYEADPTFACPTCGKRLKQVITAPRFLNNTTEFKAFRSPVDGSIITTERGLRDHNARNGVMNVHEGYSEKTYMEMTKQDFQKPLDQERKKDLLADIKESITMTEQGYKPQPASEGDTP